MSFLEALILGLVQGLSEFLPISSSGHLVFVQHLLGFREPLLFFDVVVHVGTVAALLVYFAGDLAHIARDSAYGVSYFLRGKKGGEISELAPYSRWAWGILLASLPTTVVGILFRDWFEGLFGSLEAVGTALLGTTLILWATRYFQKGQRKVVEGSLLDFLIIGMLQGLAIIPGISRSGATIAAGLFIGLKREEAFRFAFLLSIPAILGAGLLEFRQGFASWEGGLAALGVGFGVAALSGYIAIRVVSVVVQKGKFHRFAFYTLPLGLLILAVSRWWE